MTAKEYLQQAYDLSREIQLENEKLERMRSDLYGKSPQFLYRNNGGKGSNYGGFENKIQAVIDYEEEIQRKINGYMEKLQEIESVIKAVKDSTEREILTRRYLFYQKWEEIATAMGYSCRQVWRIHGSALEKLSLNVTQCH